MTKYNDRYSRKVITPSTAVAFNVETGFYPKKVEVINLNNAVKMEWHEGMADDSAIVTLPVAATAAVGTVAAAEGNTGGGTSPAMAGTYSGKGKGNLVLTCVLKGEMGTAKMDAKFPDGTEVKGWVTGASNTAKEVGQGVTFKLTNGTGDDLAVGDVFTSALTPGGNTHIVTSKGISVDYIIPNLIDEDDVIGLASTRSAMGIKIALNTDINVLSNTLIIAAE
jgi:hypothetical protein